MFLFSFIYLFIFGRAAQHVGFLGKSLKMFLIKTFYLFQRFTKSDENENKKAFVALTRNHNSFNKYVNAD